MLSAHTVADVRAAEEQLAARLPPGELMQRAAQGLRDAVLSRIEPGARVVALIGAGNNGGDALFAAGLLRRTGILVDVCFVDPQRMHKPGLAAALAAGAQIVDTVDGYDVVLDAVLGIGGRPGLQGRAADLARDLRQADTEVIAVDLPSGLAADDPRLPAVSMPADAVVTFGTYKVAGLVDPAAGISDAVPLLVDIGLNSLLGAPRVEAFESIDCMHALRSVTPRRTAQKYSRGVVGIAAGSARYAGAAHLCVAGAQAGFAGMVRFVGTDGLSRRVVDRAPEVVAGHGRVQAWAVGSGTGQDAAERLQMALSDDVPVVIDADALAHLPEHLGVPALLTPHAGELAAMMDTTRAAVEADPLAHAEAAAARWSATLLLKGRRTIIATPGRTTRVNLTGTPWLATAGSGDVLAGLAASMIAAGLDTHEAATVAAYVHGVAAQRPGGPLTAGVLAAAIPAAIAALLTEVEVL